MATLWLGVPLNLHTTEVGQSAIIHLRACFVEDRHFHLCFDLQTNANILGPVM